MGAVVSTYISKKSKTVSPGKTLTGDKRKFDSHSKEHVLQTSPLPIKATAHAQSERSIDLHGHKVRRRGSVSNVTPRRNSLEYSMLLTPTPQRKSNTCYDQSKILELVSDCSKIFPASDKAVAAIASALRSFVFEQREMYEKLPLILKHFKKRHCSPGETICRENEYVSVMYIVQEGTLEAHKNGELVDNNFSSSIIGKDGFLYDENHEFTVKSQSSSLLWGISHESFNHIQEQASVTSAVKNLIAMKNIPFCKTLTSRQLKLLSESLEWKVVEKNSIFSLPKSPEIDSFIVFVESGKFQIGSRTCTSGDLLSSSDIELTSTDFSIIENTKFACISTLQIEIILEISLGKIDSYIQLSSFHPISEKSDEVCSENVVMASKSTACSSIVDEKFSTNVLEEIAVIGAGAFGRVSMVRDTRNNNVYAMKRMSKKSIIESGQIEQVFNEKLILSSLDHPFLLKLYGTFQDDKFLYIVTDIAHGGELWNIIYKSNDGYLSEKTCIFYAANVALALQALHSSDVIYRDLKPENLILDRLGYLTMIDMGFAKKLPCRKNNIGSDYRTKTICGTPEYLAPEFILGKGYGMAIDYWALGILIYEMLLGCTPFENEERNHNQIFNGILMSKTKGIPFPKSFKKSHAVAKKIIDQLCTWSPYKRLGCGKKGIKEIQDHAFFKKLDWNQLLGKKITPPCLPVVQSTTDISNFSPEEMEDGVSLNDSNDDYDTEEMDETDKEEYENIFLEF